MKFNFDESINRNNTNSAKWDEAKAILKDDDIIPVAVADMDFKSPSEVINALNDVVQQGVYGYVNISDSYYNSVQSWMKKRYDWNIEKEWIVYCPRIIQAVSLIIQNFTQPGDKILVQTPGYPPLKEASQINDRIVVENPLIYKDGKYFMDFEDLENKIDEKVKILMLCSPHNPVGRVWTKEELEKLGDICVKRDIMIISDEIHADFTYEGSTYTPIASISKSILNKTITCTSPMKTFNVPGIQIANIIIENEEWREKFKNCLKKAGISNPTVFVEPVLNACYNQGEPWFNELKVYLDENFKFLKSYLKENLPKFKIVEPEGTYLVWIDLRELNMNKDELNELFIKKAKVAPYMGSHFGECGEGFIRLNIACQRSVLKEVLERLKNATI